MKGHPEYGILNEEQGIMWNGHRIHLQIQTLALTNLSDIQVPLYQNRPYSFPCSIHNQNKG